MRRWTLISGTSVLPRGTRLPPGNLAAQPPGVTKSSSPPLVVMYVSPSCQVDPQTDTYVTFQSCGKSFCPSHRFPKQHSCAARSTNSVSRPSPTPSPQPQPTLTRLTDKLSNVNIASLRPGQSGPAAAAATAAMSREAVSAKPKPTPVMARSTPAEPAGPSSNKPSVPNPFNKTDRCDPHLPFSANADVAPAADKRPASIDTSFRPPSIF